MFLSKCPSLHLPFPFVLPLLVSPLLPSFAFLLFISLAIYVSLCLSLLSLSSSSLPYFLCIDPYKVPKRFKEAFDPPVPLWQILLYFLSNIKLTRF